MKVGVFVGLVFPALEGFYMRSPLEGLLLTEWLGVSQPVLAVGVLLMAVGAFFGAEKLEAIMAAKDKAEAPPGSTRTRNLVFAGLGVAAVIGLFTLPFEPDFTPEIEAKPTREVAPMALAQRLVRDPTGVILLDVRDNETCAKGTIPGAAQVVCAFDPAG